MLTNIEPVAEEEADADADAGRRASRPTTTRASWPSRSQRARSIGRFAAAGERESHTVEHMVAVLAGGANSSSVFVRVTQLSVVPRNCGHSGVVWWSVVVRWRPPCRVGERGSACRLRCAAACTEHEEPPTLRRREATEAALSEARKAHEASHATQTSRPRGGCSTRQGAPFQTIFETHKQQHERDTLGCTSGCEK